MYNVTMKVLFLVVVINIYVTYIHTSKPRSLNVNLETIFEFDEKDRKTDLRLIDDVQHFLSKVKKVLGGGKKMKFRRTEQVPGVLKFTDFIENFINMIRTYQNNDLEDVFYVIDNEFRQYHYKGCKFRELLENDNIKTVFSDKLEDFKQTPGKELLKKLEFALRTLNVMKMIPKYASMLDYINTLYKPPDAIKKMKATLLHLEAYKYNSKRTLSDLTTIIKDGIRNVIFDHYSKLTEKERTTLKIILEGYFDEVYFGNETSSLEELVRRSQPVETEKGLDNVTEADEEKYNVVNGAFADSTETTLSGHRFKYLTKYSILRTRADEEEPTTEKIKEIRKKKKHIKKDKKPRKPKLKDEEEASENEETTKKPKHKRTTKHKHKTTTEAEPELEDDVESDDDLVTQTVRPKEGSLEVTTWKTKFIDKRKKKIKVLKHRPVKHEIKHKKETTTTKDSKVSSEESESGEYADKKVNKSTHAVSVTDSVVQRIGILEKQFADLRKKILIENEKRHKIHELEKIVNDEIGMRKINMTPKPKPEILKIDDNSIEDKGLDSIIGKYEKTSRNIIIKQTEKEEEGTIEVTSKNTPTNTSPFSFQTNTTEQNTTTSEGDIKNVETNGTRFENDTIPVTIDGRRDELAEIKRLLNVDSKNVTAKSRNLV